MADPWASAPGGITGPITKLVAHTKSDTVSLTDTARALYVGGTGDVALVLPDDTVVTLTALAAGVFHPIRWKRANAATTATGIVAGY